MGNFVGNVAPNQRKRLHFTRILSEFGDEAGWRVFLDKTQFDCTANERADNTCPSIFILGVRSLTHRLGRGGTIIVIFLDYIKRYPSPPNEYIYNLLK